MLETVLATIRSLPRENGLETSAFHGRVCRMECHDELFLDWFGWLGRLCVFSSFFISTSFVLIKFSALSFFFSFLWSRGSEP